MLVLQSVANASRKMASDSFVKFTEVDLKSFSDVSTKKKASFNKNIQRVPCT